MPAIAQYILQKHEDNYGTFALPLITLFAWEGRESKSLSMITWTNLYINKSRTNLKLSIGN